jgi:type II secretory pathway component PulJ
MSKSILTLHKEIEKAEYAKSPLGIVEKKLGKIYQDFRLKNDALPESVAKQVYDIREENEKWITQFTADNAEMIKKLQVEWRDEIDERLLKALSKELKIVEAFLQTKHSTTENVLNG